MIKELIFNNKKVPVPVPVQTLDEALQWIEETLIQKQEATLTKAVLNGKDVFDIDRKKAKAMKLTKKSQLVVQADVPRDLSVQTVDAIRDLAAAIEKRLKEIAIVLWQEKVEPTDRETLKILLDDLGLIWELVEHANGILDYTHQDMAPVNGLARLVRRAIEAVRREFVKNDWKKCASVLLNRLEPLLRELVVEAENLELRILSAHQGGQDAKLG